MSTSAADQTRVIKEEQRKYQIITALSAVLIMTAVHIGIHFGIEGDKESAECQSAAKVDLSGDATLAQRIAKESEPDIQYQIDVEYISCLESIKSGLNLGRGRIDCWLKYNHGTYSDEIVDGTIEKLKNNGFDASTSWGGRGDIKVSLSDLYKK